MIISERLFSEIMDIFDIIDNEDDRGLSLYLAEGANPNVWLSHPPFWTPLQCAIDDYDGTQETISILLKFGANPNLGDKTSSYYPLIMSIVERHYDVTKQLLNYGADPNIKDEEGRSPLRLSIFFEDLKLVKLLLEHGAIKSVNVAGGVTGMSPLGIAIHKLNIPIIKLLIEAGANPHKLDGDLLQPLERLPDNAPSEIVKEIKELTRNS